MGSAHCVGRLLQRNVHTDGGIIHPDEDRRDFAADDCAGRMEGASRVGAGEDTCTVERVDLIAVGVRGLHVGDAVVRDGVDGLVAVRRLEEDVDKLAAGNRLGHLLVAELLVALVKDALADAVVDVGFVPVAAAIGQRDLAVLRSEEHTSELQSQR